jgi:hypothetical protein
MRAIPQVGDRSVVYSALSEWIENKLQLILEKNLVLPNMDDVVSEGGVVNWQEKWIFSFPGYSNNVG